MTIDYFTMCNGARCFLELVEPPSSLTTTASTWPSFLNFDQLNSLSNKLDEGAVVNNCVYAKRVAQIVDGISSFSFYKRSLLNLSHIDLHNFHWILNNSDQTWSEWVEIELTFDSESYHSFILTPTLDTFSLFVAGADNQNPSHIWFLAHCMERLKQNDLKQVGPRDISLNLICCFVAFTQRPFCDIAHLCDTKTEICKRIVFPVFAQALDEPLRGFDADDLKNEQQPWESYAKWRSITRITRMILDLQRPYPLDAHLLISHTLLLQCCHFLKRNFNVTQIYFQYFYQNIFCVIWNALCCNSFDTVPLPDTFNKGAAATGGGEWWNTLKYLHNQNQLIDDELYVLEKALKEELREFLGGPSIYHAAFAFRTELIRRQLDLIRYGRRRSSGAGKRAAGGGGGTSTGGEIGKTIRRIFNIIYTPPKL